MAGGRAGRWALAGRLLGAGRCWALLGAGRWAAAAHHQPGREALSSVHQKDGGRPAGVRLGLRRLAADSIPSFTGSPTGMWPPPAESLGARSCPTAAAEPAPSCALASTCVVASAWWPVPEPVIESARAWWPARVSPAQQFRSCVSVRHSVATCP